MGAWVSGHLCASAFWATWLPRSLGARAPGCTGVWLPAWLGALVPGRLDVGRLDAWVPGCLGSWVGGRLGASAALFLDAWALGRLSI